MSLFEYDKELHERTLIEEGREEGRKEGERLVFRINTLNLKLSEAGRTNDIIKAASDIKYQEKLLQELGI